MTKSGNLEPRVSFLSGDKCDVDVPNEFMTLEFRRTTDGRVIRTGWSNWNSDAPSHPSAIAASEAERLANQSLANIGQGKAA